MTVKYVQDGKVLDYTAGADIASGDLVVMGEVVGVALADIADTETGSVAVECVFDLTCLGTDVIAIGDVVYWDAGNSRITTTASTHKCAGFAAAASPDAQTTCRVKLNAFTVAGA